MRALRWCVIASVLATAAWISPSPSHAAATAWQGDERAAVRLVTATEAVGPEGDLEVGVHFRFGPGWHGSWRSPGDAGLAPRLDPGGSRGVTTMSVAWPAPRRLVVEGLQTFVYDGEVVLPIRFRRSGRGPVHVQFAVRYAVCGEVCVPYSANLALDLPEGVPRPSPEAASIERWKGLVPSEPDANGIAVTAMRQDADRHLVLDLTSRGAPFQRPDLFVEGLPRPTLPAPRVDLNRTGSAARLTLDLPAGRVPDKPPMRLTLVDGGRSVEFPYAAARTGWSEWLVVLATALTGGLILNAMPCVLPVLSIKAFALARHAGAERRSLQAALTATAGGILCSFLLIGGVLAGLKARGIEVGWGIQFQAPWFLVGMSLAVTLFAASLFEWVHVGLPGPLARIGSLRGRGPLSEAFLAGAFATLLATPCSAPFVGSAVGFALTRDAPEILAVFAALGIGMGSPFLLLAMRPGAAGLLPKPGRWMVRLRVILGGCLLGTAIWLIVLLGAVAGMRVAYTVALSEAVFLGLLFLGRRRGLLAPIVAAAAFAWVPLALIASPAGSIDRGSWRPFVPTEIPALVAAGHVVLVDVTAEWCLTCKLNEITTLDRGEVRERIDSGAVVAMRADWTRPDAAISGYLRRFARFGIPLVVVYGPGIPDGEALPEILTPWNLGSALTRATARTP